MTGAGDPTMRMPGVGGGTPPTGPPPATPAGRSGGRWWWAAVVAVVAIAVLIVVIVLAAGDDEEDAAGADSTTTASASSTTAGETTTATDAPATTAVPTTQAPTTTAPARPAITEFVAPATVDCDAPTQIELAWNTQNATRVTVSIDGPGVYDEYGPAETVLVPFACDGQPHTYELRAYGDDGSVSSAETRTVNQAA
jgi:cytoskeletal protein RodZ